MPRLGQLKSHCYMGHPLSGDNVRVRSKVVRGKSYVERGCKICHRTSDNRRYGRKKEQQREANTLRHEQSDQHEAGARVVPGTGGLHGAQTMGDAEREDRRV